MTSRKKPELHTPDGLRDFLPEEYAFKLVTERNIENVFHRYGYVSVSSPTLEYMEVFEGGGTNTKLAYKLIDRNGEILMLRPDMTPAIARIAATHYTPDNIPMRFCYLGNNFRYSENNQGKQKEFTQAGVELIGIDGDDADGEAVAVAINALLEAGLTDFRLDLGHARFLAGVLEETGLSRENCLMLHEQMVAREYTAVEHFISNRNIPTGIKELFNELPLLTGDIDILKKVRTMISNSEALSALNKLESIYSILADYRLNKYVLFDLSMTGHLDYYTGLIFRGYTYGTGFSVLDGGRYNNLLGYFGCELPSVGFAIKIDDLAAALENQNVKINMEHADTLLVYNKEGRSMALATGDDLRSRGVYVENSMLGEDIAKNTEYAKSKHMGGILYFTGKDNVSVINLNSSETLNVTIDQLLRGEGSL